MADNSNYQFNSLLIRTFQPGAEDNAKNTDKLKYHYTSPDALLSILKNQKIFFTDIRFLNDKSEDIYFVGEKMRCPCKEFFDPIYAKEQQLKHNNHK